MVGRLVIKRSTEPVWSGGGLVIKRGPFPTKYPRSEDIENPASMLDLNVGKGISNAHLNICYSLPPDIRKKMAEDEESLVLRNLRQEVIRLKKKTEKIV